MKKAQLKFGIRNITTTCRMQGGSFNNNAVVFVVVQNHFNNYSPHYFSSDLSFRMLIVKRIQ